MTVVQLEHSQTEGGGSRSVRETAIVKLSHYESLGNDFLIVFCDEVPGDAADQARLYCDRAGGIGADGLIYGTPSLVKNRLYFNLFNSDGSPAEVSGNGLNCFAQAIARGRGVTHIDLTVDTVAGARRIMAKSGLSLGEAEATVEMGPGSPGPSAKDLELDRAGVVAVRYDTVDLGNPHLVIQVDDVDEVDLGQAGPILEAFFSPVGCNIHVLDHINSGEIRLRPWERGAGLTQACGSGACAGAYLAERWGLAESMVKVVMPGGVAVVHMGSTLALSGPTLHIGDYEVSDA